MTIEEIKELIRVVQETGIAELEVRQGDGSVRIRSASAPAHQELVVPTVLPVPIATAGPPTSTGGIVQPPPTPPEPPAAQPATAKEELNDVVVKSPIVGTYYDGPSPEAPPFVRVGDRVKPKQILCIIESMKLMNEIEAELAGEVIAKHIENGRPVEYGESLFTIRPA
jgi:acetyl-CoA carboxylase biotin carboxyl carrier protein